MKVEAKDQEERPCSFSLNRTGAAALDSASSIDVGPDLHSILDVGYKARNGLAVYSSLE